MKIGFFQTDLVWEDPEANLSNFEEKIAGLKSVPDVLLLPEMFNTGFSMQYAEHKGLITEKWMKLMAKRYQCTIAGSYAVLDKGGKFNRFIWVHADGSTEQYDKMHLFSHGDEDLSFTHGAEKNILEKTGIRILPLICYDLRFPILSYNTAPFYDVLIYVASWPEKRIDHWQALLKARAIENQCYVVGVNRLGTDGNNLNYCGSSLAIKYDGSILVDAENTDGYFDVDIDKAELDKYRHRFNVLGDTRDI